MNKSFTIPMISISEIGENFIIVDVRSPKEFEEFSLPTSMNVPIFNNEERVKVGTVYKQKGKKEAIKLGLVLFSTKISDIYDTFIEVQRKFPKKEIVVSCARGGMRSSSIVSTLNSLGVHCVQLQGGIRSYRESIVDRLQKYTRKPKSFYVVSGNTGTMKTDVLHRLKEEGYPVIDLEGLAGHRGSVFGDIGIKAKTQKQFEALLVDELERYNSFPYYIIESESKRIGKIVVPDYFIAGKENGIRIELNYPLTMRVEYLVKTYEPEKNHQKIVEAFSKIKKRLQGHIGKEIENLLNQSHYREALQLLLTNYYDPAYEHTTLKYNQPKHVLKFTQLHEAVEEVRRIVSENEQKYIHPGME